MKKEILGFLFIVLNGISFYTCSLCRNTHDLIENTKESIYKEFFESYKIFGRTLSSYDIEEEKFKYTINGLKKIHFSSHEDIHQIEEFIKELCLIVPSIFTGFALAIVSMLIGYFFFAESSYFWSLNVQLIIVIPFIIVLFEWSVLIRSISIEKELKRMQRKYINREY